MTLLRALLTAGFCFSFVAEVKAETNLSEFAGQWNGRGQDRDLPMASWEPVTCRDLVRVNQKQLYSELTCDRASGLHKVVIMTVTQEGNQLSGKITRKESQPGKPDEMIAGSVSGTRTGDTASLLVRWEGATPNTTIALKLITPTSYTLQASVLNATIFDVTFRRAPGERAPSANAR